MQWVYITCPRCGLSARLTKRSHDARTVVGKPYCDKCFAQSKLEYMRAWYHKTKQPTKRGTIRINGCVLVEQHGRCEKYLICQHYEDCLDAAVRSDWIGWRTA